MKNNPHIKYLDMGPIPVFVGVVSNKKNYDKEIKRLNVRDAPVWDDSSAPASTMTLERTTNKGNQTVVIVKLRVTKVGTAVEKAGLATHEASHVVDSIMEAMDEEKPSPEFKAYLTQYIAQGVLQEMK